MMFGNMGPQVDKKYIIARNKHYEEVNTMEGKKYVIAAGTAIVATALAYKFPAEFFIAFAAGWIFGIPALFLGYLAYGLLVYRKDVKNRIVVHTKPSAAMQAVLRRELDLQKEKEYLKTKNF